MKAYVDIRSKEDEIIAKYISVTPVVGRIDENGNTSLPPTMYHPEDDVPPHVNEKGIRIMNVVDFMKDPNSLEKI